MRRALLLSVSFSLLLPLGSLEAQDLHPSRKASPMGMARTHLGEAYLRVVSSRPYLRGRDNIFGPEETDALVPFGKVWRTGANEGTELTVTADVRIGDQELPAGTYTLFTTPGAESWSVHVNGKLGYSGTFMQDPDTGKYQPAYDPADDVVTYVATPTTLDEPVDQLTFSFEDAETGKRLVLRWATTEIRVPFTLAE